MFEKYKLISTECNYIAEEFYLIKRILNFKTIVVLIERTNSHSNIDRIFLDTIL